jgi:uncharacterized protein YggU (UPF0235/DUF167 family)
VYLKVRVTPGARETAITGWQDETLRLKVREPAEKGRANEAAIRLLAASLNIPISAFALKRGQTSREKLFEIDGLTDDQVRARLGAPML